MSHERTPLRARVFTASSMVSLLRLPFVSAREFLPARAKNAVDVDLYLTTFGVFLDEDSRLAI